MLLSSCAIQHTGKSIRIQSDTAAIFGTELARFNTADNESGVLRKDLDNRFSLKIGNFQVISLGNARKAKLVHQKIIGQQTILLIETEDDKCSYSYQLFAIAGSSVDNWMIGNCSDKPKISENEQEINFDFPAGNNKSPRLARYVYRDERLVKKLFELAAEPTPIVKPALQPGKAATPTKPKLNTPLTRESEPPQPTFTPAPINKTTPPSNTTVTPKPVSKPNVTPVPTPLPISVNTSGSKTTPTPMNKPIVFSEREEKPVRRIDLTKDNK